jgi:hypothetical protein
VRDLLVIVPTMNRPAQMARLHESFHDTSAAGTDLAVVLDRPYASLYDCPAGAAWLPHPSDRAEPTTIKINYAARQYKDAYRTLMFCGDDHTFTPGWDTLLLGALDRMGGTGFAYPKTERLPDLPEVCAVTADVVRALGWLALPVLRHYFIDNAWKELGEAIGRYAYVPESVVPHHHWSMPAGMEPRAARDECYERAITWFASDRLAWHLWRFGDGFGRAVARLQTLARVA